MNQAVEKVCPLCGKSLDETGFFCKTGHPIDSNSMSKIEYEEKMRFADEIMAYGVHIDDWSCNLGEDGFIQENGTIENIYYYGDKYYSLVSDLFGTETLFPVHEVRKENETGSIKVHRTLGLVTCGSCRKVFARCDMNSDGDRCKSC